MSERCGCIDVDDCIEFCPLHRAAPDLLEAAEVMVAYFDLMATTFSLGTLRPKPHQQLIDAIA